MTIFLNFHLKRLENPIGIIKNAIVKRGGSNKRDIVIIGLSLE